MFARPIVADRGAAEPISLGAALVAGKKTPPDALVLLEMDHLEAFGHFDHYALAVSPAEKQVALRQLVIALTIHMRVEEEIVYPTAREAVGDETMVEAARQEHAEAKKIVAQLARGEGFTPAQDDLVDQLKLMIQAHVTHEETDFFPRLRATGTDLYALGREVAARRLELLLSLAKPSMETIVDHIESAADAGRPVNTRDAAPAPVGARAARELYLVGLRNIHAVKREEKAMIARELDRLERYPKLIARLRQALQETDVQMGRIEAILERLGESPSGLKDVAMSMMGNVNALSIAPAGDEIFKTSFATAGLCQFEIAAYEALLVLAEACGSTEDLHQLQRCLNEERALAAWLSENLRGTVITHLQLRSAGETAKH